MEFKNSGFFGSALHDTFNAESDIDILVEFDPDRRVGFLSMARMEKELSRFFGGKGLLPA